MRVQTSKTRFRIPDVCLTLHRGPIPKILTEAPFLVIEVLSDEDRVGRVDERLRDYRVMGVPYIFVVDPADRSAFRYDSTGLNPVADRVLRTANPEIAIDVNEYFHELDGE
jgi:Uma2 family endonuclease